jgi:glutamate/tyrosine decarboxylase-like PLP-dependent enzyme/N-acetylglutamate synthase-like GNAT family acetyltransferase
LEKEVIKKSFRDALNATNQTITIDMIRIIDYQPTHQPYFESLNRSWIEKYFWMEPIDMDVLQKPDEHIMAHGGFILMAQDNNAIVGTVALKWVDPATYEFTKMAVDEKLHGKKIGLTLAEAAIAKCRAKGASRIILYSNTVLASAIALYRKLGFVEVPLDGPYKRSNIKMELQLTADQRPLTINYPPLSTLANDSHHLPQILEATRLMAIEHLANQQHLAPGRLIPAMALKNLPQNGVGAIQALQQFNTDYAPLLANSAGSRYFGFVTGGSTPAALAADWLVSAYDQNACGSHDSIAPQIEHQTIHFFKQLFGLDNDYFGSFVTGATVSNLVSLAIARQWVGERMGVDVSQDGAAAVAQLKVLSATIHSSAVKSMAILGMGRNALVRIDTLPALEAIDLVKLEDYLVEHACSSSSPVIVIANAGTVNTVDFDDLAAIGRLKQKYNFWLHVDAAFGGFAAASNKFAHLMQGINEADSITIDAHKWLNVPYDAAMQFTKHKNLQLKVFQNSAAYLGDPEKSPDFFHYTPENSRRFRALPAWMTLMAYGKEGYAELVERNCACAKRLADWIETSESYQLLAPARMNVVCFTLITSHLTLEKIQHFLATVRDDGRVFFTQTIYKGTPAIRAAISNWQTQLKDIEIAITVLTELSQGL